MGTRGVVIHGYGAVVFGLINDFGADLLVFTPYTTGQNVGGCVTGKTLDSAHQLCLFQYSSAVSNPDPQPGTQSPPPASPAPNRNPDPPEAQSPPPASPAPNRNPDQSEVQSAPSASSPPIGYGNGQDQNSSQTHEQRIFHLEQALDQALDYLTELGTQVNDQQLLEEKLAATEDYAFVQYQAIARFQDQLAQYQDKLEQMHQTIAGLEADNTAAQTKLLVLQQDRAALQQENGQWQHACQELQQECDRQHRKISALEHEKAAMQEQILQQARQSNEYETAVQYWKDQCKLTQDHLQSLLDVIEKQLTQHDLGRELDVGQLHQIVQSYITILAQAESPESLNIPPSSSTSPFNALKIPDFLMRRYQSRSKADS